MQQPKDIVLGFDISGTEIRMEVFQKARSRELFKIKTERAKAKLVTGFDNIIGTITQMANGIVDESHPIKSLTLALGVPARFQRQDGSCPHYEDATTNVQQPVSGIHLGADCPGKNWVDALQSSIQKDHPKLDVHVALMNDAGVQLTAMLMHASHFAAEKYERWAGGTVVYVGPGTGFGASVADIDKTNGSLKIRHNAHMYDAMVEITPEQEQKIKALFTDYTIVQCTAADKIAEFDTLEPQTYGKLFPLQTGDRKNLYIIEHNGKKHIIPVRYMASKDGLEHLLDNEIAAGATLEVLGNTPPEQMKSTYPTAHAKLELIGELMGAYLIQFADGKLRRLQLGKGVNPVPYDKDKFGLANVKAILLGGGAMRDAVGEVMQQAIVAATAASPKLHHAEIYRPDSREMPEMPSALLCETAANRGVHILSQEIGK